MTTQRIQTISFFVVLIAVFILVAYIFKPFINILAVSTILTILFHPVYKWIHSKMKYESVSALATVILILIFFSIPVFFFGQLLFNELLSIYDRFKSGSLVINPNEIVSGLPENVQSLITQFSQDINQFVGRVSSQVFDSLSSVVSNVASFVLALFITAFTVFYLLKDGDRIKKTLSEISPIADAKENILFKKIGNAVNGVVKGQFLTAMIQGIVATIGFYIFGIPEPIVWGSFTIIAALVPTVGTSLSIIPAIIYLISIGNVAGAIGLAVWGFLAVGLIDNFIGPKIVGSSTELHPLLVLFSILGGVQFFGFFGILIGPIVMSIFMVLLNMYRKDFT